MTTTIKERPILFSGPMVRAILAGQKIQTRRIIARPERFTKIRDCGFCCPYGAPGERLWVRETWCLNHPEMSPQPPKDGRPEHNKRTCWYSATEPDTEGEDNKSPWKSPIFMPRWASRLSLEVVAVRVERLQEISEADAIAEGIKAPSANTADPHVVVPASLKPVNQYRELWDHINGERADWASNPWVWVVEFKRVQP